jgi:hypothetical protein
MLVSIVESRCALQWPSAGSYQRQLPRQIGDQSSNSTAKALFDDKDLHASFRTSENSRQSYTFHDIDSIAGQFHSPEQPNIPIRIPDRHADN